MSELNEKLQLTLNIKNQLKEKINTLAGEEKVGDKFSEYPDAVLDLVDNATPKVEYDTVRYKMALDYTIGTTWPSGDAGEITIGSFSESTYEGEGYSEVIYTYRSSVNDSNIYSFTSNPIYLHYNNNGVTKVYLIYETKDSEGDSYFYRLNYDDLSSAWGENPTGNYEYEFSASDIIINGTRVTAYTDENYPNLIGKIDDVCTLWKADDDVEGYYITLPLDDKGSFRAVELCLESVQLLSKEILVPQLGRISLTWSDAYINSYEDGMSEIEGSWSWTIPIIIIVDPDKNVNGATLVIDNLVNNVVYLDNVNLQNGDEIPLDPSAYNRTAIKVAGTYTIPAGYRAYCPALGSNQSYNSTTHSYYYPVTNQSIDYQVTYNK